MPPIINFIQRFIGKKVDVHTTTKECRLCGLSDFKLLTIMDFLFYKPFGRPLIIIRIVIAFNMPKV